MSEPDIIHTGQILDGPQQYQADMLPPLSCPRLVDRPRELRQLLCVLLICILIIATITSLIWISGVTCRLKLHLQLMACDLHRGYFY